MNHGLLFLHAITPLHNGAGQGIASADRPIIREVTTQFPFIQSSTLKGAMRFLAKGRIDPNKSADEDRFYAAFGSGRTPENLGCLQPTDAQLLLFPVRSLKETFAWVTCDLALARLLRALELLAPSTPRDNLRAAVSETLKAVGSLSQGEAFGAKDTRGGKQSGILLNGDSYYLENLALKQSKGLEGQADRPVSVLASHLADLLLASDPLGAGYLTSRFLIVSPDDFTYFARRATELQANIQIEDSGVTKDGSLRYTEYLPAESVLVSLLTLSDSFHTSHTASAAEIADLIRELTGGPAPNPPAASQSKPGVAPTPDATVPAVIQFGADESKGKGLARTILLLP